MSYSGIYIADLSTCKQSRINFEFADFRELVMMSRTIIYFTHYSNLVMDAFLHSNETMEAIINNMKIVSLDDYLDGADLI